MTNWLPDLEQGKGPLYLRLAERIESDIAEGILAPGTKLPPQRNLAFDIGVTIGTVGRAYNLIRERGLVSGEVGRGTYVTDHKETSLVTATAYGTVWRHTRTGCRARQDSHGQHGSNRGWTIRRDGTPAGTDHQAIPKRDFQLFPHPPRVLAGSGKQMAIRRRVGAGTSLDRADAGRAFSNSCGDRGNYRSRRQDCLRRPDLLFGGAQRQSHGPPQHHHADAEWQSDAR